MKKIYLDKIRELLRDKSKSAIFHFRGEFREITGTTDRILSSQEVQELLSGGPELFHFSMVECEPVPECFRGRKTLTIVVDDTETVEGLIWLRKGRKGAVITNKK